MAKLWNQFLQNIKFKNASSGATSGGGSGSINRDPKAIQVKRVGYQFDGGGSDDFAEPRADFELIDKAILKDSYIQQAMMKYSELIFKSGWLLKGKNEQALEYLKSRLEMMAVATGIPTEELFQGIADDIVRYSNCFIVKASAQNGVGLPPGLSAIPIPPRKDPIGGYFRLPPQSITIARDVNGTILKYKQEVQGADDPLEFNPEDIIHITVNKPVGRPFGDPWIAPVLEDVRLLRKVEENAALLLYRHLFPLLTYTVGTDKPGFEASDEEIEELQNEIENMPTDGVLILPERHKLDAVNIQTIDGKPYLEYFEQRVFTGLGMSTVDMGRGDTANRNTADAMSGIKADRVKGWQKQIQVQIDKYIIDEILVEGGFDPLANPEYDVDFTFEEIEQEKKIAKENHAILKWNSNLQTFEETRHELGLEPSADESRLMYLMIGAETSKTSDEVSNKNAPENQHGKQSAPKNAESFSESVFEYIPEERFKKLHAMLIGSYHVLEHDTIDVIESYIDKRAFPVKSPKSWMASLHFSKDKMLRHISENAQQTLSEGMSKAKKDTARNSYANINSRKAGRIITSYASESLDRLEELLKTTLSQKLENCKSKEEAVLAVKGVFKASNHRLSFICRTLLAKSFNFGYSLSLRKYGEEYVQPNYEGSCTTCKEQTLKKISLQQFSSLDEVAIFYRIPPWHPNCDCSLELIEGGEKTK
ncbi:hypothetical protein KC480_05465 [Bacillus velezensis]|uniref:hypothetical protein n=1 Tax=Bacillus velezensis TaxID=492670 RepID=UPI001E4741C0|nr:hypothetical protein [Bacillus velezensis]MCD7910973.1 hypothetical protein [Bacillus velezensis]